MNWEAVGAAAEIVGAIAVVLTLIYLAIEVRNNRSATESASLDALAAGFNTINAQLIADRSVEELWLSGIADPEQLDEVDRARFWLIFQSYMNQLTALKKYHIAGVLSEDEWTAYSKATGAAMSTPGGRWIRDTITTTPKILSELQEHENPESGYPWLGSSRNS